MTLDSPDHRALRTPLGEAPAYALIFPLILFLIFREEVGIPSYISAMVAMIAVAGWYFLGTVHSVESSIQVAILLAIVSVVGMASVNARISRHVDIPKSIESTGVVLTSRKSNFGVTALVKTRSRGMFASGVRYVLKYDGDLAPGDVVNFSGDVEKFKRADESGKFDEFLYWKSRGALAEVRARRSDIVGREFGLPYIRNGLSGRVKRFLPRRVAGYLAAAWLGERDRDLQDFHSNAGTSHILAVSGLHIGMAAGICWLLVRRLKYRLYIMSVVIWLYVLLSGASPSAVRAALMLQFIFAGRLLGQSGRSFNGVCFVASAMLLWNPWIFWDVGWRMSVLSVMALAALHSLELGNFAKFLLASPVMWLVTSVQAAWTFGAVPLSGVVINFFAVPFFGILLPAASLLSIPALFGWRAGAYPALLAEAFFALWERFSNNITFLIPWKLDFSYPLYVAGILVMTYIFARACGFPRSRAYFALAAAAPLALFII